MNVYVVVEGKTEKAVYESWIPLVNPQLAHADTIWDVDNDKFYLVSGFGYPGYFDVIDNAIFDVDNLGLFDRLVIAVDSEDMTREEKCSEILEHLNGKRCSVDIRIVVQHFCLETLALGNRRVVRRQPTSQRLIEYKRFFDVRVLDPELLPPYLNEGLNRAQFAVKYLRAALNERKKSLTYSKGAPKFISNYKYFGQVRLRFKETQHIASFGSFLEAFV